MRDSRLTDKKVWRGDRSQVHWYIRYTHRILSLWFFCVFGVSVFVDDHQNKDPQATRGAWVPDVRPMTYSIIVEEQPLGSKNIMQATTAWVHASIRNLYMISLGFIDDVRAHSHPHTHTYKEPVYF
jgi:hypothetical protein